MKAVVIPAQWRQAPTAVLFYLVGIFLLGFTIDGGIYSVLQNLYLLRLGYGPEFVGIFNSSGLFVFAVLSLPVGTIRRWTNRRLLLLGNILTLLGMFVIPLAQWSPTLWQPTLLLGGRVLSLVGLSFFFVHGAPYLMAVTAGDWQNRALAWQSASLAVAGFVGGLLGGYLPGWIASWMALPLSDPTPYQYPLFLGAGVFGLAFFAFWRTPEPVFVESLALARGESEYLADKKAGDTSPSYL
jgi:MFS family permease